MKPKQEYKPLINAEGDFVSPNRKTYLRLKAQGLVTERVGTLPFKREEPKVMNGRTKAERKSIHSEFGGTGTNLKKKHLQRLKLAEFIAGSEATKFEGEYTLRELINIGREIRKGNNNE